MTPAMFVLSELEGESGESDYSYRNNFQSTIVQDQAFGTNKYFLTQSIFW